MPRVKKVVDREAADFRSAMTSASQRAKGIQATLPGVKKGKASKRADSPDAGDVFIDEWEESEARKRRLSPQLIDVITRQPVDSHPVLSGLFYYIAPTELEVTAAELTEETVGRIMKEGKKGRILPERSVMNPESSVIVGIIDGDPVDIPGKFLGVKRGKDPGTGREGMMIGKGKEKGTVRWEIYERQFLEVSSTRAWQQLRARGIDMEDRVLEYLANTKQLSKKTNPNMFRDPISYSDRSIDE